jgi:hypothetical protein
MTQQQPDPTASGATAPTSQERDVEGNDNQPSSAEFAEAERADSHDLKDVMSGSVASIKEWVGDNPQRAQKALDAENASGSTRSTLVSHLEGKAKSS